MSNIVSNTKHHLPRLILTIGEPAGIGPDLVIKIAQHQFESVIVVISDPDLLRDRADLLDLPLNIEEYHPAEITAHKPGHLVCLPAGLTVPVKPGQPDPANAGYVMEMIRSAVENCMNNNFDAMVTGPVNKAIINQAGYKFSGHTEYIAELCKEPTPVMMLANEKLRIALVTTHIPLSRVGSSITASRLEQVINIVHSDLQEKFRIGMPHILVCGLNPHAGEQGYLGNEEIEMIIPVLERLRGKGLKLTGPVPADTAFVPANLKGVDAVLTMYHDQGLPVLKSIGFGGIVNITLGLPIIRTSVDHGTAFELSGTGKANADSMIAAIKCAIQLTRHKTAAKTITAQ